MISTSIHCAVDCSNQKCGVPSQENLTIGGSKTGRIPRGQGHTKERRRGLPQSCTTIKRQGLDLFVFKTYACNQSAMLPPPLDVSVCKTPPHPQLTAPRLLSPLKSIFPPCASRQKCPGLHPHMHANHITHWRT